MHPLNERCGLNPRTALEKFGRTRPAGGGTGSAPCLTRERAAVARRGWRQSKTLDEYFLSIKKENLTLTRFPYFATFASGRGGGLVHPLAVSKFSVIKLSRGNQRIALDKYSRLVVRFFILGQYLTQLLEFKGQTFAKSTILQSYTHIFQKL